MKARRVASIALPGLLVVLSASDPAHAELQERQSDFASIIELRTADGIGVIEIGFGPSPATFEDARLVADTILALANGDSERGLLPSPSFEAIVEEATANAAGRVFVRVERDSSATALGDSNGEPAKGLSPSQVAFDVGDFERLATATEALEMDDEQLRADAARLVFLAAIAHEFRHAGIGNERIVTEDGQVVLQKRDGGEDQYRDPKEPTIPQSPARAEDEVPKGPAVEAENEVLAETFGNGGLGYVRNNYGYTRQTDGALVYDFTVTVPSGGASKTATVVFNADATARLLSTKRSSSRETVQDAGFKLDAIPQLGADTIPSTGADDDDGGDGGTGGGQTPEPGTGDGSNGEDGGDETSSDDGSDGSETDSSGGDATVACTPDAAVMSGRVVPQAGVELDVAAKTCEVVSGLPPGDLLVIDDFGGVFGGSGSGATVLNVVGGSFVNADSFYTLENLLVGEPVAVTFEGEERSVFTVEFTIDDTGVDSALTDVAVTFEDGVG